MNIPILIDDEEFNEKVEKPFDVVIFNYKKLEELILMSDKDAAKWIMKNKKNIKSYDFSKGFEKTKDTEDNLAILWDISNKRKSKINVFVQMDASGNYPEGWYEMETRTDWLKDILKSA